VAAGGAAAPALVTELGADGGDALLRDRVVSQCVAAAARLPPAVVLAHLRPLAPRLHSISSSAA
jgi:sulfite reductase alpha subunit-like flavoprotein